MVLSAKQGLLWVLFLAFTVASLWFTIHFFSSAFPLVSVNITMDLQSALSKAKQLREKQGWRPHDFSQVATFRLDEEVQFFIELEEGKESWRRLLTHHDYDNIKVSYYPYEWMVRHFVEGDAAEVHILFSPDGKEYGFEQILPEDETGVTIDQEEALKIAEDAARADPWNVNLELYNRVEASHVLHLGGRTDHTFRYEQKDLSIGRADEGKFRLTVVVSGDKLTELRHSVKIPDSFIRRYQEMRSFNNTIGMVASLFLFVLFVLCGYGLGLFFLLRQGWILWKQPLIAGAITGFLMFLDTVNNWPLMWLDYQTAEPSTAFIFGKVVNSIAIFISSTLWYFVSFMAAESLTRKAFPHHLQIWKLWGNAGAESSIVARTISGYFLVPIFFAYDVGLYLLCSHYFGWWTPSSIHDHPDILSTPMPWISSIAVSLQAGSWEECCFRAVPLSMAALVGQKFNCRKIAIGAMMIIQAVIFGAAHANYPSQPSYARLVELIIPSLMFGGVYLKYGLLPTVIAHFVFDVVWFALPIFISSTSGVLLNQVLIVLLSLAPLIIALFLWMRTSNAGKTKKGSTETCYNSAWKPPTVVQQKGDSVPKTVTRKLSPGKSKLIIGVGLLFLVGAFYLTPPATLEPPVKVLREDIVSVARDVVRSRMMMPTIDQWKSISIIEGEFEETAYFMWKTEGKGAYIQAMKDGYVPVPSWVVRFVRFDESVDLLERAEEFMVKIDGEGKVLRVMHILPEARPGKNLTRQDATQQALAIATAIATASVNQSSIRFISAESEKRPQRLDWLFKFSDDTIELKEGETRIVVELAGDEYSDGHKTIHISEEWARNEHNKKALLHKISKACQALIMLLALLAFSVAVIAWSVKGIFDWRAFGLFFFVLLVIEVVNRVNLWPMVEMSFETSEPLTNQLLVAVGLSLMKGIMSAFAAILPAFLHKWNQQGGPRQRLSPLVGVAAGFFLLFVSFAGEHLSEYLGHDLPSWANYGPANAYYPIVTTFLVQLKAYTTQTIYLLLVATAMDTLTHNFTRRRVLSLVVMVVLAVVLVGASEKETVAAWLGGAAALGVVTFVAYAASFSYDPSLVPVVTATAHLAEIGITQLYRPFMQHDTPHAFPGELEGNIGAGVATVFLAYMWWRMLQTQPEKQKRN